MRTIFLPKETVDLLIQEHAKHPTNPIMFPSPVTGKLYDPDCIGRLHKNLLKKAGITESIPFHGLQHTFAALAIQQAGAALLYELPPFFRAFQKACIPEPGCAQSRLKILQKGMEARHPAREIAAKMKLPRTVLPCWSVPCIPESADAKVAF